MMRVSLLVMLVACVPVCGRDAAAQAIGSMIRLDQQSTQSVQDVSPQPPQLSRQPAQGGPQQAEQGGAIGVYDPDAPARSFPDCGCAKPPLFPVDEGDVAPGSKVTITSPDPDAVIYYTADGWTPTEASPRYSGPITIDANTRLQAIAEEPNKLPSTIAEVTYILNGPAAPRPKSMAAVNGILLRGTPVRLVTGAEVRSDTAQVGDALPLLLDEDVMMGDKVVAPKGSKVKATITRVEQAGRNGKPGVIGFEVQSLDVLGIVVPLRANMTMAAPDLAAQAQRIANPTMVHVTGGLPDGDDAEIEPGMTVTATVGADIGLRP
jgi:Chitobiase/beta-hexosaminidase C-terminal domain